MNSKPSLFMFIRRSRLAVIGALILCLLAANAHAPSTFAADDERTIRIIEAKGSVTVKKSGGSLSLNGYQGMTLSEGDSIAAGTDSHVILRVEDEGDEITVGADSELYISDLSIQQNDTVTRLYLNTGSAWVEAHSLSGDKEVFEMVTTEGALHVRGTNFLMFVNPLTGQTSMVVASGIVQARQQNKFDPQQSNVVSVYPAQQINLDSRTQVPDLKTKVGVADIEQIVNQAPAQVLESIIRNSSEVQQENEQLMERLKQSLEKGSVSPDANANLYLSDQLQMDQYRHNIDQMLLNIAKQAVDAKKIDEKQMQQIIDEANQGITDPKFKLDRDRAKPLDRTAGLDPEVEKAKQQANEAAVRAKEEQRQMLDNQQRLASLIAQIEQAKRAVEEANRQAAEEAAKRAEEQLKQQLDEAARKAFEERKQRNEQSSRPVQTGRIQPGGPGSAAPPDNSGPNNPGPTPSEPEMSIALNSASISGNTVTAALTMSGFTGENSFFAVEVHLLYDSSRLSYQGNGKVARNPHAIFGARDGSTELIRAYEGERVSELLYAAAFGLPAESNAGLSVEGEQLLVEIPLTLIRTGTEDLNIQLIYFKVVDQDGNTVLDGSDLLQNPVTVPVQ
ncbi:FecR domain-containing protein [Marinicrinis lubricantis]|uniref:FecR domain-containing protein n=1 Tax=Marinicrinis lubricantis TaxID=2086470 RepID=A0ABW1ISZ2_9BACL